jgi:hypothetical protein
MSLKDALKQAATGDDRFITRAHMEWVRAGRVYTEAAVERVLEQMRVDFLTSARSGEGRVRASMLHDPCLRKQQLSYRGEQPAAVTSSLRAIFDIGTFSHYRWQLAGLSAGWLVDIEVKAITDYGAGGSLDGVTSRGYPFEFKTANGQTYRKVVDNGPMAGHVLQVQPYMEATDTDRVHIVYEDKSWDGSFVEYVIHYDEKVAGKVRAIAQAVAGQEEYPPVLPCTSRSGEMFKACTFADACKPWEWA